MSAWPSFDSVEVVSVHIDFVNAMSVAHELMRDNPAVLGSKTCRFRLNHKQEKKMKLTELLTAVELLRKEGWRVEPSKRRRSATSGVPQTKRMGRPPKNGRRKRGRP